MINEELIRQEYGFLNDMIHVNACSVGVPPMRTRQAAEKFWEPYFSMVCDSNHVGFEWLRQRVREQLARLIGGQAEEIAFTKNTTEGTAILASGYPLGPGDNVVVADLENASNLYPWLHAAEEKGFQVRLVKTDGRGVTLQQYLDVMDEHTRIAAVSAVQAGCGARIDLAALGKICRERGIVLSVDAVQCLGRLSIDVKACNVDFLTCGGFKGLAAGFGIGFLYCRKELAPGIRPMCVGSGSTATEIETPGVFEEGTPLDFFDHAGRFEGGSTNTMGIWLLHHSLSLLEELGQENIRSHVLELEQILRRKLSGSGLDVFPSSELPSGMVVARYPAEQYEKAEEILKKYRIRMSHHRGYLRLSIAVHNTAAQMEQVAAALCEIGNLKGM